MVKKKDESKSIWKKDIITFGPAFSDKEKENFYLELSVLLKAGVNLRKSLQLVEQNTKKTKVKTYYAKVSDKLIHGSDFYLAIQSIDGITQYESQSIRIGEESGKLESIIEELGHFFARKNEHKRKLINALSYPLIILTTAIFVVFFMLRFVVPMFQDIFNQNQVDLPWITNVVIFASEIAKKYLWAFLLLIIILLIFVKSLKKQKKFMAIRDKLVLKTPVLGPFVKAIHLARFNRAMNLLMASNIPIIESMDLVEKMMVFIPLKNSVNKMKSNLIKGKSLSESALGNSVFDSKMIALLSVAEETNQTQYMFQKLNEHYTILVEQKSKLLSTFLEPLIILIVGVFVGIILIAMYIPMFKLSSVLGA